MFAKINHVAIVSEKYALITKFYEAAFGMYQSKTSPKSALTVGDGYVGLNINPRKAGRPAGLDHFGIQVEDVETAFDRMRTKYPEATKVPAALVKQAYAFAELGENSNARLLLQEVVEKYAQTPEATQAKQKLKSLES